MPARRPHHNTASAADMAKEGITSQLAAHADVEVRVQVLQPLAVASGPCSPPLSTLTFLPLCSCNRCVFEAYRRHTS